MKLTAVKDTVSLVPVTPPEGFSNAQLSMPTPDVPLRVTFSESKFIMKRALLSVLRAGYLAAFGATGYRLLPRWERIRRQILHPGLSDPALHKFVGYERDQARVRRHIGLLSIDTEEAVYVALGRWRVILPLDPDSRLYGPFPAGAFSGEYGELSEEPVFGLSNEELRLADGSADGDYE